jgi:hypothetical protein
MVRTVWHHPKFATDKTGILKEHLYNHPTFEGFGSSHTHTHTHKVLDFYFRFYVLATENTLILNFKSTQLFHTYM